MNSTQRIGVVTVTYNSSAVLSEFLDSVSKQTHMDFLFYIVDSGSTDGTERRIRKISDPRVHLLIQKKNVGFAVGCNLGIRAAIEAGCTAILLLNNDTVFGPELFEQLCKGLDTYGCEMITPKVYYHDEPNKVWAAGGYFQRWLGYRTRHYGDEQDLGQFDSVRTVNFAPFCCVLIREEVFRRIGYLDENYFVYMEDDDYCYRAMKAGIVMKYLPTGKMWHKVSALTGGMSDFTVQNCIRNRVYFLHKNIFQPLSHLGSAEFHLYLWARYLFLRWRRLTGKDSEDTYRLKLSSHYEGIRLCALSMSEPVAEIRTVR